MIGLTLFLDTPPLEAVEPDPVDRVTFRSESGSGRISLRGRIVNYRGESITVKSLPAGNVHTFPVSQVVRVETLYTPFHVKGLEEFTAGHLQAAQLAFEQALDEETRDWARREILAMLVRCATGRNDYATAGARFLLLIKSDPLTHHFHLIPLLWAPLELDPGAQNVGRQWLKDQSEIARLLGASLLLDEADSRLADAARLELHKLATSPDRRVQQLAQSQRYRLRLSTGQLSREELESWESRIEAIPEPLRGGPYYVLGKAYLKIGESERGAAALLWLPFVYDENQQLAARACVEAAESLAQVGQSDHADSLLREVVFRFPTTEFGRRASTALAPTDAAPQQPGSTRTATPAGHSDSEAP